MFPRVFRPVVTGLCLGFILYSLYLSLPYINDKLKRTHGPAWMYPAVSIVPERRRYESDQNLPAPLTPVVVPTKAKTAVAGYSAMQKICNSGLHQLTNKRQNTESRILMNTEHNLGFCNVPKVGSSFWFAAFAILEGFVNSSKSPSAVLMENIQFKFKVKTFADMSPTVRRNLLDDGYLFLFVRNPYYRLLSAYMNKFRSPNGPYWSAFGKMIVSAVRTNASELSKGCGHDVTFEEFLHYVSEHNESDHHWAPLYTLCSPCHYPYKFIGRLETFDQDAMAVIRNTNISHLLNYDSSGDQQVKTYMAGRINEFVKYYNILKKCLDFPDTMRRLWDYYKFKGFIPYDSVPPAVPIEEFGNDAEALKADILSKAYSSFTNNIKNGGISLFGEQFVTNAYRKVSTKILHKIKNIFLPDFLLFGYDPEPEAFFEEKTTSS